MKLCTTSLLTFKDFQGSLFSNSYLSGNKDIPEFNTYRQVIRKKLNIAPNKKNVTVPKTIKIGDKTYKVTAIGAKAFTEKKIRKVTIGANVKKIAKNAFAKSKATKIVLKTRLLTKKSVKGSLKSSKVKTIQVRVGAKKTNKKFVKTYKKFFTKKNAGRKASVK